METIDYIPKDLKLTQCTIFNVPIKTWTVQELISEGYDIEKIICSIVVNLSYKGYRWKKGIII
jgi:hypothetical protein